MTSPSWFDWLTVAAIFTGPIFALLAQRKLDHMRDKKERRLEAYMTLMSQRAAPLHPEYVRAVNSLDTIFDSKTGKDAAVRNAWQKVLEHSGKNVDLPRWNETLLDLRIDLYQALGKAVGYSHTVEYLKTHIYSPLHYSTVEQETTQIRQGLAKALSKDGLTVILRENP